MPHDVTYQHKDYSEFLERSQLVEDVCENRVKKMGDAYLPRPNPKDESKENKDRYDQYLKRAIFYNATGYTQRGLVGAAFTKVPTLTVPSAIGYVATDIDGAGVSIYQQSQTTLAKVLRKGRHGLLADFPRTQGPVSRAQMSSGFIRAKTVSIDAASITNWKTMMAGGKHLLSLVVYRDDQEETSVDGFGVDVIPQYRALRLIDGRYTVQLWRKDAKLDKWVLYDAFQPVDGAGRPWEIIPFTFVGSQNNDPGIDMAPLYDMAVINIGHYRNSADYEDSAYFCGQAQPWASGLTQEWVSMLEEKGFYVGSRQLFPVPEGGEFGIAQAEPNTMVKEAMDQKEKQMVALGARIIQPGTAVKTATEAQGDRETEHSILSLCVSNVSEAYTQCLEWMNRFMNSTGETIYEINQEFTKPRLDAQMLTGFIQAWQSGKYPETDFWAQLRKYGLIDPEKTDDQIKQELEESGAGLGLEDGDE